MKNLFIITTVVGLMSCGNDHEVRIMGTPLDYTQDTGFVSDSVFLHNQSIIDSLMVLENEKK